MSDVEKTDSVVEDAKAFYDYVNAYDEENRKEALLDKEFLRGDQWDLNARRLREVEQRPCLTFNVLPSFVQQVVNDQRQNKTNIKTFPVEESDEKLNEIAQGLIKHIEYASNADVAYDRALQSATEIGFGYWRLITDYCNEKSFDQEVKYASIRNPFSVYFDPNSIEADGSDQKKCLIAIDMPRSAFKEQWPDAAILGADYISATGNAESQWATDQIIRVGEFYRVEETDATLYQLPDGKTAFADELKELGATEAQMKALKSRQSKRRKVMLYKVTGAEVLESAEIKCPWIPVFPVWGTEIDINGKVYRQGMIRAAKDPAKMYNVLMTAATEEVASRTKAPWIGAEGQFEGHEKNWRQANRRNFAYLEYKPKSADGQLVPPPQRQPMTDVPAGFLTMAGHARDDIKATTGIFDASLGAAGNETSGKAIVARQRQGDVANFHYRDNLVRTQKHCGRCILKMIPNYYDATRLVRIMGEDETIKTAQINTPQLSGAEQFLNDTSRIADFDITVSTGPAYQTQQQEATEAMVQLSQANPNIMAAAGDLVVRNLPFKGADEIADRLKLALPPTILGQIQEDDKANPQAEMVKRQAMQAIDQLNQQIQAAEAGIAERDQALQQLQEQLAQAQEEAKRREIELAIKAQEVEIKQFEAETERLQVMKEQVEAQKVQEESAAEEAGEMEEKAQMADIAAFMAQTAEAQTQALSQALEQVAQSQMMVAEALTKPKRKIVTLPDGRQAQMDEA